MSAQGCRICSFDPGPDHTEYFHHPRAAPTCKSYQHKKSETSLKKINFLISENSDKLRAPVKELRFLMNFCQLATPKNY